MMAADRNKLLGLQLGRAIAAISVVATHAIAHPFPGAPGLSHLLGRYGVTLFFVISGYIMVATTGEGKFARGAFVERRIKRILPVYYVATFVLLVARMITPGLFKNTVLEPVHFVKSLLFWPAFQPNGSGLIFPFFRLGWTLNYEIFFYFCFAVLAGVGLLTRVVTLTLLFLLLFFVGLIWPMQDAAAMFYTQVDLIGFVAGMWLGVFGLKPRKPLEGLIQFCLAALSIMLIGYIAFFYHTIRLVPSTQLLLIVACAIHLRLLLTWVDDSGRSIPRFAVLLGDASYSIYLFHMFSLGASVALSKKLGGMFIYLFMPVSLVAGVIGGLVMYWLIERPIGRCLHNWSFKRTRPIAVARS